MSDDNALIRAFQGGDAGAFRALYDRHKDGVFFYALTLTGSEHAAEEAVQEAFLAFLRNVRRYEARGDFRSYLRRAVRSRALDGRRRARARREVLRTEVLDLFEGADGADAYASEQERRHAVSAALLALPPEQREVVILRIFDGLSFPEIAELTGVGENTAASRYRYARGKLREKLKGLVGDGLG